MRQLVVALLLVSSAPVAGQALAASDSLEPAKFVYLLDYIARDYEVAVRDGAVINQLEFQEMKDFSVLLVDRFDDIRERGASEDAGAGVRELRDEIGRLAAPAEVRALASSLAARIADELDLTVVPGATPRPGRGRRLYADTCAPCHGASGGGDGPSAKALDPPATSFRGPWMNRLAPRQLHGAITFGIDGTAMPAYGNELDDAQIWDLAFFILTLRDGFDPLPPGGDLPLSLADLATLSGDELLEALRALGVNADARHIDHYRSVPRSTRADAGLAEARKSREASGPQARGADLEVARHLQNAFAEVASRAAPSVVGVTGFVRRDDEEESGRVEGAGSWTLAEDQDRRYPGFGRARSGSGIIVSDDGYILTAQHLLRRGDGETVDLVDVELHTGRRVMAGIVGIEPTINLAVLKIKMFAGERPARLQPAVIGDGTTARVGHWAIALGNPWGPGKTFSVGTIASQPQRQCYQEDLSATLLQSSVDVSEGGYGGPLVNIEGEVVGMMVPRPGLAPGPAPAGAPALALPIELAMTIFEPLKTTESRVSPWLGIAVLELAAARQQAGRTGQAVSLPRTGVYIDGVFEPGPAAAAGIRVGDTLVAADGRKLMSPYAFQKWLYLSGVGRKVTVEIYRDGETLERSITVQQRPTAVVPR